MVVSPSFSFEKPHFYSQVIQFLEFPLAKTLSPQGRGTDIPWPTCRVPLAANSLEMTDSRWTTVYPPS